MLGEDIEPNDLDPEVQQAYALYSHERYLTLFEQAASTFGLDYAYYIVPTGEKLHMYWMLDAMRDEREDGSIDLGIDVEEELGRRAIMWEAWETGRAPDSYETYDNELGKTYAWYYPLFLDGSKLGLIGTEVEISAFNQAIAHNTARQLGAIALIPAATSALTLWLIDRLYISKIRRLSHVVDVNFLKCINDTFGHSTETSQSSAAATSCAGCSRTLRCSA